MDTTKISTPGAFAALLERQAREREDAAGQLLDAERRAAASILGDLHPDAGEKLTEALDGVERHLRADHRAGTLLGRVTTSLPEWMDSHFPALDPDDPDAGRRRVNVFVARPYADGHVEPTALALVDISDVIYGRGSRKRRDQLVADDQRAEAGRDREIQRDRTREALRR
jgi:hypothetical protein